MKFYRLFLSASILLAGFAGAAPATTHFVSRSGIGQPPFTNWYTAATNIQHAVSCATNGSLVLVSNGTWLISAPISITNGITVRGYGGITNTIVDGNYATRCFYLNHSNAALEDFTITRGQSNAGNGVYLDAGTLRNCRIAGNRGTAPAFGVWAWGGGVYLRTNCIVENCLISSNYGHYGGGVYLDRGGIVRDCRIVDNGAANGVSRDGVFGGMGGGAYGNEGGLVTRCVIASNWAEFYGGGFYGRGASRLARCAVKANTAGPSANWSCNVYPGGGGIFASGAWIENCLVSDNLAGFEGGGVYCAWTATVHSCTIVTNVSLSSAVANGGGGGLYNVAAGRVRNCIIYFNGGPTRAENYADQCTGIVWTCAYPLPLGDGNTELDPRLVSVEARNFYLADTSPCIDAGTPDDAPPEDFAGVARPLDGDLNGTARFDMGAYEFASPDGDTDGDGQDDLSEAISGSDGTNTTRQFCVVPQTELGGGRIVVSWETKPGRFYTLKTRTSLSQPWSDVPGQTNLPGTGGTMSYTSTIPSAPVYFTVMARRTE